MKDRLSIVMPTIQGRAKALQETIEAYTATTPASTQLVVVENYPTVGEAWNAGAASCTGDRIMFAIDDAVPDAGWLAAADEAAAERIIPSPVLRFPDGSVEGYGTMGLGGFLPECEDWTPCRSAGVIFCRSDVFKAVGLFLPIHYYVDDDWCWRAVQSPAIHGVCVRTAYSFRHLCAVPGRAAMQARAAQDRDAFLAAAAQLGGEAP